MKGTEELLEMGKQEIVGIQQKIADLSTKAELIRAFVDETAKFSLYLKKIIEREIITKDNQQFMINFIDNEQGSYFINEEEKARVKALISRYHPYVLDVKEIKEVEGLQEHGIMATVDSYGKMGLIQRVPNTEGDGYGYVIHHIAKPIRYTIHLMDKDNMIVKVGNEGCSLVHLIKNEYGKFFLEPIAHTKYEKIQDFDNDGIAFVSNCIGGIRKWGLIQKQGLVQKNLFPDGRIKIKELLSPMLEVIEKNGYICAHFDEYNAFETNIAHIGRVVLRKKFIGEYPGIDVFKKGRMGKEVKIEI